MMVRSLHLAFAVPDADAAQATLYYPGDGSRIGDARLTGVVPAFTADAPWPIVLILPGININPDSYRWLAHRLVHGGFCAVTYSAIGSLGPAGVGITPGIDMAALSPDVIGSRPSASAVPPLLDAIANLGDSPVAELVDLHRVALVGHSAGGTVALHNSNPDWIPGLRAVASFGAHTMTATGLGHEEATIVSVPARVPLLLAGAAHDAVIDASRDRYRSDDARHDPVGRTFDEAISRADGDTWLIELAEANHFTMCHPVDESSGRSFLEPDLRADDMATRDLFARLLVAFLGANSKTGRATESLEELVDDVGIERWARR